MMWLRSEKRAWGKFVFKRVQGIKISGSRAWWNIQTLENGAYKKGWKRWNRGQLGILNGCENIWPKRNILLDSWKSGRGPSFGSWKRLRRIAALTSIAANSTTRAGPEEGPKGEEGEEEGQGEASQAQGKGGRVLPSFRGKWLRSGGKYRCKSARIITAKSWCMIPVFGERNNKNWCRWNFMRSVLFNLI